MRVVEYGGEIMTNTKKKTIMFLSIAMLLIVFFVVAFRGEYGDGECSRR